MLCYSKFIMDHVELKAGYTNWLTARTPTVALLLSTSLKAFVKSGIFTGTLTRFLILFCYAERNITFFTNTWVLVFCMWILLLLLQWQMFHYFLLLKNKVQIVTVFLMLVVPKMILWKSSKYVFCKSLLSKEIWVFHKRYS